MPKSRILAPADGARLPPVATATLGRPFHLLPVYLRTLQQALADFVQRELNARYRARFALHQLAAGDAPQDEPRRTWHRWGGGAFAVHIERRLLLQILDYRYGGNGNGSSAGASDDSRETETEHRLARLLGNRLSQLLLACVQRGGHALAAGDGIDNLSFALHDKPSWEAVLTLADDSGAVQGRIALGLDDDSVAYLLQQLAGDRLPEAAASSEPLPFTEQLRLRLRAQLLEKQLPLGEVLDLQVGSVLPIRLPPQTDVYVGRKRLFAASVVDRGGKLCLTSFQDVE